MAIRLGVFDSGVGGLTVLRAVRRVLPSIDIVYLGDTARVPYGTRSMETIIKYSLDDAKFLEDVGVSAIVVACHTASAIAIPSLRRHCKIPVIGVVEPSVKEAIRLAGLGTIGIIGTDATISSNAYQQTIKIAKPKAEVIAKACPLFVPLAEEGWVDDEIALLVAKRYLNEMAGKISALILACTHYPLLKKVIAHAVGHDVALIDPAEIMAQEVARMFENPVGSGTTRLCVTDVPGRFHEIAKRFLGSPAPAVEKVIISSD